MPPTFLMQQDPQPLPGFQDQPFLPIPPSRQELGFHKQSQQPFMPQQQLPQQHQPPLPDQPFFSGGPTMHAPHDLPMPAGLQDLDDFQAASHVAENLHLLDSTALQAPHMMPGGPASHPALASLPMPGHHQQQQQQQQQHPIPPMNHAMQGLPTPHSLLQDQQPFTCFQPGPAFEQHNEGQYTPRPFTGHQQLQGSLAMPARSKPVSLPPLVLPDHRIAQQGAGVPRTPASQPHGPQTVSTQQPPRSGSGSLPAGQGHRGVPESVQSILLEHLPQDMDANALVGFLDGPGACREQYDLLKLFPARSAQPVQTALLHFRQPGQAAALWAFLRGLAWEALTGVKSRPGAPGLAAVSLAPGSTVQQLLGSVWVARGPVQDFEGPPGAYSLPQGVTCLFYSANAVHPAELARPDSLQAGPRQRSGPQAGSAAAGRGPKHAPIVFQRTPGGMQRVLQPSLAPKPAGFKADQHRWGRQVPGSQPLGVQGSGSAPHTNGAGQGFPRQAQQGRLEQAVMSVLTAGGHDSRPLQQQSVPMQQQKGIGMGPRGLGPRSQGPHAGHSDSPRHSADFGDDFLAL